MAFKPTTTQKSAPKQQTNTNKESKVVCQMIATTDNFGGLVGLRKSKEGKTIVLNQKAVDANPKVDKKYVVTFAFNSKDENVGTNFREFVITHTQCQKLKDAGFKLSDCKGTLCKIRFAVSNDGNLPVLLNLKAGYTDEETKKFEVSDFLIEYDKKEEAPTSKKSSKPAPEVEEEPTEEDDESTDVEIDDDDLPF